ASSIFPPGRDRFAVWADLPGEWGGEDRQAVGGAVAGSWGATREGVRPPVVGPGTQPAGMWATICCVPRQVITPNVVAVQGFHRKAGAHHGRRANRRQVDTSNGSRTCSPRGR